MFMRFYDRDSGEEWVVDLDSVTKLNLTTMTIYFSDGSAINLSEHDTAIAEAWLFGRNDE